MIKLIDNFLNRITMYRLVLYFLICLLSLGAVFSYFHLLPYDPLNIVFSGLFLFFFSSFVNDLFSKFFKAPTNFESTYITALILALIINPVKSLDDFFFLAIVSTLAMASKYILAIKNKHLFNPVAVAAVITSFTLNQSASWWVGNIYLLPFVVVGGYLIVRKTQKEDLVLTFLMTTIITITAFSLMKGSNVITILNKVVFHTALFFFASIMITEPLTMPPTYFWQIIYGIILGFIYVPDVHLFGIYSTPELTLLVGNLYSYIVSPKIKLLLPIKEKIRLTADTIDFTFPLIKPLNFIPGQYMEWTLSHQKPDSRGNRRYFTLASSPTEDHLRLGVKFYDRSSSYKRSLLNFGPEETIVASQIAGDFTLPKDKQKKLVFMAGGIGITPFRSMLKYLLDKNEHRDIVLFYSNKNQSEIVYKNIFDEAQKRLDIKVVYTLTDLSQIPSGWLGKTGRINAGMIIQEVPDILSRTFYLSGPRSMVDGFEMVLKQMGIKNNQIKTDFFPGFV